jgi:alkylmercury lyase
MTTTTDIEVQRAVSIIRTNFRPHDIVPKLYRLFADGEPVTVERLATAGGWPVQDVRAELERHPGTEWDNQGRVVGFGVSIRPTPHTFSFDGETVYGWCATAVLELPIILGRGGVAQSTCPATGRHIRVELTPHRVIRVDPAEAVVSKVRPTEAVTDIRAEICNLGSFFGSPEAAADWLTHNPQGHVDPITTEFTITRRAMSQLGWIAP